MKNTFKRTLALALAVVMLLSVCVIGVSAEDTEVALNGGVNTDTVTVYEFWQEKYASDSNFVYNFGATDMTTTISEHYAKGELNWKVAYTSSTTDSCTGKSLFSAGRPYHYVQIGKSTGNNFYGLYLKSPGAGTYNVTLNYSVTNDGQAATEMKAYLFPATFVENGVSEGTQWKYMISNNDDKAENGTDTNGIIYLGAYSCYDADVEAYEVRTLTKTGVELSSEKEYILVLAAANCTVAGATTMKHYTNKLALEKTSADSADVNVKAYDFYYQPSGTAYSGTWYDNSQKVYDNYETSGWRYEAASTTYQMDNSNTFDGTAKGMRYFAGGANWYAIRIKAPAAGVYNVKLDYGQIKGKAGVGDVYMFPASAVDKTLDLSKLSTTDTAVTALINKGSLTDADLTLTGEAAADKLGVLQAADMWSTLGRSDGNAINTALKTPINDVLTAGNYTTLFTGVIYYAETSTTKSEESKTLVTFPAVEADNYSDEYIVVFKFTSGSDLYNSKLTFTEVVDNSVAVIESPESAEINFTGYANGTGLYANKAAMDAAFSSGTASWNFEMCENPDYYYTDSTVRSYFKDAAAGIEQWMGTAGFLAVRIKSPVSGEYDVTLSHGTSTRGATGGEFYLVPAPNAAYTETEVEDLMANSNAVASTNFTGGTVTNNNLVYGDVKTLDSFRYTFTAGQEYLLIAKVTEGTTLSTAAGGTVNYGYLYMCGIELTPTVSYKSAGQYDSFRAALAAAEEDENHPTVKLLSDIKVADLGVTCNIDLNGNDLTVYGDMTSVATVSDSKDGEGVLTVTGEMILAGTQAQLPLYDAAVNGCRLYSVTWGDNNQSEAAVNNAKKYWFQLYFDNTAAYDLIATGTSGLSIGVVLDWDTDSKAFDFVDKTEHTAAAFAAGWGEFMKTAKTPWIWVNVLNVVEGVTVTPVIEANGAQIACAPIA